MSEQVVVKSVSGGKPWNDLVFFDVVFDRNGSDFFASWGKKGDAPQPGEQVEGEFFEKGDNWRFRKASKPQGSSGFEARASTGGGQSKGKWQPEQDRDPERSARILRQHSQTTAIQAIAASGIVAPNTDAFREQIKQWTDWFDQDVIAVGQAAVQAHGTPPSPESATTSPVSDSRGSDQPPADEHMWFCKLLEAAGLSAQPASKLADFILAKFDPDQIKRADRGLGDMETMAKTLASLESVFRKTTGEVLVAEDPDEDIPF